MGFLIATTLTISFWAMNSHVSIVFPDNSISLSNAPFTPLFPQPKAPFEPLTMPIAPNPAVVHSNATLCDFLKKSGLEVNQTLFVTMADEKYAEPMINFKLSLDKWDLSGHYVVLCLDASCSNAAASQNILHYDGYYKPEDDTTWKASVAKAKVYPQPPFSY